MEALSSAATGGRSGPVVEIEGLSKRFGPVVAVDELSLSVAPGSFTALLGPSGCGKSTTLALLAGLLEPDAGEIRVDGRSVLGVPPQRRPIGLVFQKPLLFPHLSVAQNVAFGLRMRRWDRSSIRGRVTQMLARVQLAEFADRRVGELSGGQEQRVALARALVLGPPVLLLDEPFSQLDTTLREEMRALVRRLHDDSDMTTVFVTHDQGEAVQMADSIALMLAGRLAGHESPETYFTRPPSLAAARFFAATNEIPGRVMAGVFVDDSGHLRTATPLPNGPGVLVVRPEALVVAPQDGEPEMAAAGNAFAGRVTAARFAGTHLRVEATYGPGAATVVAHTNVAMAPRVGETIRITVPPGAGTVFTAP